MVQLLYLMLPVYLANMVLPFVRYWHIWNRPMDARLLSSHKRVARSILDSMTVPVLMAH